MSNYPSSVENTELQNENVKISDIQKQTKTSIAELFWVHENQEIMSMVEKISNKSAAERLSLKEEIEMHDIQNARANANKIKVMMLHNQLSNYFA